MKHPTSDELALHYYGDSGRSEAIEAHLRSCALCAREYAGIVRTLHSITITEPPDLGPAFVPTVVRALRDLDLPSPTQTALQPSTERRLGGLAAAIWLAPLLYPLSFRAIFHAAQLAPTHNLLAIPLVMMSLTWALAGPFVATFALKHLNRPDARAWQRLVVYGAAIATISPALYNLLSRTGGGLPVWYAAIALAALGAAVPLSPGNVSVDRVRLVHRVSAAVLVVFGLAHVSNHMFAAISLPAHQTVLETLRLVYRQRVIEVAILAAVVVQIGSGVAMLWHAHLRGPKVSINLQALSGLYLAVFFLAHVSAVLMSRPSMDTNFVWAAGRSGLLTSPRAVAVLPYYLSGLVALFVHVGYPARRTALALMPEIRVRRLSYAAAACGAAVVLTIGLALCGIRVTP